MSNIIESAVCEFCGQVLMADVECECKEAKQARRILDQIERAKEAADEIFGENSKKKITRRFRKSVWKLFILLSSKLPMRKYML